MCLGLLLTFSFSGDIIVLFYALLALMATLCTLTSPFNGLLVYTN